MANGEQGRPTAYKEEFDDQVFKLCLLGHTDKELAFVLGVCEATINNWKHDHPSFLESLLRGKELADAEVAHSLYRRAVGCSHKDTKFASFEGTITDSQEYDKYYPPDTRAAEVWLYNRQSGRWKRDKVVDKTKVPVLLYGKAEVKE